MSERSETESERDMDAIDVVSEPAVDSKRSSLRSQTGVDVSSVSAEAGCPPHKLLLAAAYLNDAKTGSHMEFEPTLSSVKLYNSWKSWWLTWILYLALFINLSLALFEKPAVTSLELPFYITVTVEICCISFFFFRLAHEYLFIQKHHFWRDAKHLVILIILILTLIDICIYTGLYESGVDERYCVRWSRFLRPFLLVNFPECKQIRRAFRNIRRTLPEITNVLVLFLLSIAVFALMFYKLFGRRNLRKVTGGDYMGTNLYFNNFIDSYWDLYVLVTTANNPDIMMPAYDINRIFAIFFFVYIVLCLYVFMSVFLAVVYNNYRNNLKNEVKEAVLRKYELLNNSFDLVKSEVFGKNVIVQDDFNKLMKMTLPRKSQQYFKVLWCVLDVDNNGYIDKEEFLSLSDLLNIKISEVKGNIFDIYIPQIYKSKYSKIVIKYVKHKYFRYIFDLIIVINAVFIGTEVEEADWYFLAIFIIEILLKVYSFGFMMFITKLWNVFDTIVIGSAFIMSIYDEFNDDSSDADTTLDTLLVLRVLRIVKIFHGIDRFKLVLNTILHIIPSMATYGGVLFVFFYSFAIIGMESFKNSVHFYGKNTYINDQLNENQRFCGNPNLENSDFYKDHYCANNFNDIIGAFVVLFELLVVNQWHVISEGYALAMGSKYTRIYFISFHLLCVIIILNIFTAFVLEVFIMEYSFEKGTLETSLETKINEMGLGMGSKPEKKKPKKNEEDKECILDDDDFDNDSTDGLDADHDDLQFVANDLKIVNENITNYSKDTDMRFHLKKGSQNVQTLLQKMFAQEVADIKVNATQSNKEKTDTEQTPNNSQVLQNTDTLISM